jgi:hypothetical protein
MSDTDNSPSGGSIDSGLGDAISSSGGDSFTEVTSQSWLQRVGNSFVGMLVGFVLVIASGFGIFWNETNSAETASALAEGEKAVISVEAQSVNPANEGKLIHLTGEPVTKAPLADAQLGVKAMGLKLVRRVEMFQWKQDERTETRSKLGGGEEKITTYSYTRVWKDGRIESSSFKQPNGHANPPLAFSQRDMVASDARLGAFTVPQTLLSQLSAGDRFDLEAGNVAAGPGQTPPRQILDGALYIGANPTDPHVGDLRISYTLVGNGPISLIAAQTGASLMPFQSKVGQSLYMIEVGQKGAAQMFKEAESANRVFTWIIRGVALLAMWIGFSLAFAPLSVLVSVLPFLGTIAEAGAGLMAFMLTLVVGPVLIAVAWFAARPLVSAIVLVVGGAAVYLLIKLKESRAAAKRPA